MIKEKIELVGGVEISEDVEKEIKAVGVRGMDMEKAKGLGFFTRISNLLCASHASITAGYRIYGSVDMLLTEFGARKNEIAYEMNLFDKAYARFINFWTNYYANGDAGKEMVEETENLYHRIMEWAQLSEQWRLGDNQRTETSNDVAIKIQDSDGKTLYFHRTNVSTETMDSPKDSWCVTKYDVKSKKQETVNTNMDKASAMMVAKRLSDEDPDNIYTASMVTEIIEKRIDVTPYKAYKANQTIGKLTNIE